MAPCVDGLVRAIASTAPSPESEITHERPGHEAWLVGCRHEFAALGSAPPPERESPLQSPRWDVDRFASRLGPRRVREAPHPEGPWIATARWLLAMAVGARNLRPSIRAFLQSSSSESGTSSRPSELRTSTSGSPTYELIGIALLRFGFSTLCFRSREVGLWIGLSLAAASAAPLSMEHSSDLFDRNSGPAVWRQSFRIIRRQGPLGGVGLFRRLGFPIRKPPGGQASMKFPNV